MYDADGNVATAVTGGVMMSTSLINRVRHQLVLRAVDPTPARVAAVLREEGVVLGDDAVLAMVQTLRDEIAGAGPLELWLRTEGVTDVLVNGANEVWVDCGSGLDQIDVKFPDDAAVRRLAQQLAASAGRRLDDASPFVDARLPDGSRLHAVLPPIARDGTCISLRIPRRQSFTLSELTRCRTVDTTMANILRAVIYARMSFLISGGTGSGKTTILSALLAECDPGERLVIVEDSTELQPDHPHVVRLESRPANAEGVGAVALRDLVRQALRMRPDRIVVGEVRGTEILDLLSALNTGHEGGCGTIHANSARDVPARVQALGMSAGIPGDAVHALLSCGLDLVIHLSRSGGARQVETVAIFHDGVMADALTFRHDRYVHGPGYEHLISRLRPWLIAVAV
jgi:pilus assembly protein CpaF